MTKECVLPAIPSQEELLKASSSSWTKGKTLPVTVEWTTNPELIGDMFKAVPKLRLNSGDSRIFEINKDTVSRCKAPDSDTVAIIKEALQDWTKASDNTIIFKQVDKLSADNGGITFTAPASYNEMNKSAFTPRMPPQNGAALWHSVVVLPDDYFKETLKPIHPLGMKQYIKEIITHETGHALGLEHPHDFSNKLTKTISQATNAAHCTVMDYNKHTSLEYQACKAKEVIPFSCEKAIENTKPGIVDRMMLKARRLVEGHHKKDQTIAQPKPPIPTTTEKPTREEAALPTPQKTTAAPTRGWMDYVPSPLTSALKGAATASVDTLSKLAVAPLLRNKGLGKHTSELVSRGLSVLAKSAVIGPHGAVLSEALQYGSQKLMESRHVQTSPALKASLYLSQGLLAIATVMSNPLESMSQAAGAAVGVKLTSKLIESMPKFKSEDASLDTIQAPPGPMAALRQRQATSAARI